MRISAGSPDARVFPCRPVDVRLEVRQAEPLVGEFSPFRLEGAPVSLGDQHLLAGAGSPHAGIPNSRLRLLRWGLCLHHLLPLLLGALLQLLLSLLSLLP